MRWLILVALAIPLHGAELATVEEGDLDEQQIWKVGTDSPVVFRRAGSKDEHRFWLSVCLDLDRGEAIRSACAAGIRALPFKHSVLVSGFRMNAAEAPAADAAVMVAVGQEVPPFVTKAVLLAVHALHPGPLTLRAGNDKPAIITVGPPTSDAAFAIDAAIFAHITAPESGEADIRKLLSNATTAHGPAPHDPARIAELVDLDLRSIDGKPVVVGNVIAADGAAWTVDGLYLPGYELPRFPQTYPARQDPAPEPPPLYRAEVALPADLGRSCTVTLLLHLASAGPGHDNLFNLGRRSRWLSAQVGQDGALMIGIDDRWRMVTATAPAGPAMIVDTMHWHVVTVGLDDDAKVVRAAIDGRIAVDADAAEPSRPAPSRPITGDGESVLSFLDPGSNRHLHGLVRRIVVHRGLLDRDAIAALHRLIDPASIPRPTTPAFRRELLAAPGAASPHERVKSADDF